MILEVEVTLGEPDAWSEEETLRDAFVAVDHYRKLKSPTTCFICGRRGAGKSALAIIAKQEMEHCEVYGEDDQYDIYKRTNRSLCNTFGLNDRDITDLWTNLWRFVLSVMWLQISYRSLPVDESEEIQYYLLDKDLLDVSVGQAIQHAYKTAIAGLNPEDEDSATTIIQRLNSLWRDPALRGLLRRISARNSGTYCIIFDSLEQYEIGEPEMIAALKGVTNSILLHGRSGEDTQCFQVFLSMPGEIFEDVANLAPSKVLQRTIFVQWRYGELITLLTKRFIDMLRRANVRHDRDKLEKVFDKYSAGREPNEAGRILRHKFWYDEDVIPQFITNRRGNSEDTFAYIFRHTQLRPRELIYLFNNFLQRIISNDDFPRIPGDVIVSALHSQKCLQYLVRDALSPFEDRYEGFFESTRSVLKGEPRVMKGSDLSRLSRRIQSQLAGKQISGKEFLSDLLRSGAIGEVVAGEDHSTFTHGLFEYLVQDRVGFSSDRSYCVHPAVGDFFELQAVPGYGPTYPKAEEFDDWHN